MAELIPGEPQGLPSRKLTEDTCRHFGYLVGEHEGEPAHLAPYYDCEGTLVAQKVRRSGKQFSVVGDFRHVYPFGYHAFARSGKRLVLTEGELDALSVSQVQGNKYPVWSIPHGAGPQTKKWLAQMQDAGVFAAFEEVVLCFDQDEIGQKAAAIAAQIIGPRAKLADLSEKDASAMLVAGKTEELYKALWNAKPYRPEGVVDMASLEEEVLKSPSWGALYRWEGLNAITYGAHLGEILTIVAGTGIGKTALCYEMQAHFAAVHKEATAGFYLEASPAEAAKLIAGAHVGKRFHIPDDGWTEAELREAFREVQKDAPIFLYDAKGENGWTSIKSKIEYLVHAHGVRRFFVDNLTSIIGEGDDERQEVDDIMRDMERVVVQYGITLYLCVHTNRPQGTPHEEGGRVTLANIRMSGVVAMKSWIVLAMERNQQADEEEERLTTTVRCLKMRRDGSKVGSLFRLRYDTSTGLLTEVNGPSRKTAGAFGFQAEKPAGKPLDF